MLHIFLFNAINKTGVIYIAPFMSLVPNLTPYSTGNQKKFFISFKQNIINNVKTVNKYKQIYNK